MNIIYKLFFINKRYRKTFENSQNCIFDWNIFLHKYLLIKSLQNQHLHTQYMQIKHCENDVYVLCVLGLSSTVQ